MARLDINKSMFYSYCWEFLHVHLPDRMCRSKYTISSYVDTLTIFKNFLIDKKKYNLEKFAFNDCTPDLIFHFMDWLAEKGSSPSTINHRLAGIRGYLYFATTKDISLNVIYLMITKIQPLKCKTTEKKCLSDNQISLILKQAEDNDKGKRNRVMLLTLYETACRVSEIVSIKINQLYINRKNPYIEVLGKGNKERHIAISMTLSNVLAKYIQKYKDNDSIYLFTTCHRGQQVQLSVRSVQDILKRYSDLARKEDSSIPEKVHPHMFRRSKATSLYQNGMAIELVASFLGHSSISTTRVYAQGNLNMLRKEIEKSIPEESYKQKPKWKQDKNFIKDLGLR